CAKCSSAQVTLLFFFQAEDGIRDSSVTGVQTCALPISSTLLTDHVEQAFCLPGPPWDRQNACSTWSVSNVLVRSSIWRHSSPTRSEERRVGKECSYRGWRSN